MGCEFLTQIETKLYGARSKGLEPVAIVVSRHKKSELIEFFEDEDAFVESSGSGDIAYKGLPIITSDSIKNPEEPYVVC